MRKDFEGGVGGVVVSIPDLDNLESNLRPLAAPSLPVTRANTYRRRNPSSPAYTVREKEPFDHC